MRIFNTSSVHCQEIIAKLLITYPQQAMWMMMAVSKVSITCVAGGYVGVFFYFDFDSAFATL